MLSCIDFVLLLNPLPAKSHALLVQFASKHCLKLLNRSLTNGNCLVWENVAKWEGSKCWKSGKRGKGILHGGMLEALSYWSPYMICQRQEVQAGGSVSIRKKCLKTHTCVHPRARARAHARTHARTHTHTQTHTHTHTNTHTHTHTHTTFNFILPSVHKNYTAWIW